MKRFAARRVATWFVPSALPALAVCLGTGFAASLTSLAGCRTPRGDGELNVVYTTPPSTSASASSSGARPWASLSAVPKMVKANNRRFTSSGHFFGRFDADILVSPEAASAYASIGPGKSVPIGALVVKKHYLSESDTPGPMLAMERTEAGMRYFELDELGNVRAEGRVQPCVGCHTQVASQDELFGVPTTGRN